MADHLNDTSRVVLVIDVDCFEYQVWMKANKHPELQGIGPDVPVVVANSNDIILTSNYAARSRGVTKDMLFVNEAEYKVGADLKVIYRPENNGLQDTLTLQVQSDLLISSLLKYRENVLHPDDMIIELRSQDEFYVDVTDLITTLQNTPANTLDEMEIIHQNGSTPLSMAILQMIEAQKSTQFISPDQEGSARTIMELEDVKLAEAQLYEKIQNIFEIAPQGPEARLIWGAAIAFELMEFLKTAKEIQVNGQQMSFPGYEVSIGVGYSLLAAKHAYSLNKPDGLTISTRTDQEPIRKPKIEWATNVKNKLYGDSLTQTIKVGGNLLDEEILKTKIQHLYNTFVDKLESKYSFYKIRPNVYTCKFTVATTKRKQIGKGELPSCDTVMEKVLAFLKGQLSTSEEIKSLSLEATDFRPE